MNQAVIAPVRYTVTVPTSPERAFTLFTRGFNTWWIGHHIGEADLAGAVIEPRRRALVRTRRGRQRVRLG